MFPSQIVWNVYFCLSREREIRRSTKHETPKGGLQDVERMSEKTYLSRYLLDVPLSPPACCIQKYRVDANALIYRFRISR